MKTVTIDAQGKKIGRVASEAAQILLGKTNPDYRPEVVAEATVTITNVAHVIVTEAKKTQKKYGHYSGYPGGLRFEALGKLADRKGYTAIMQKAVYNMLPSNKLRKLRMKNLIISE